jgi:hypothetical protein
LAGSCNTQRYIAPESADKPKGRLETMGFLIKVGFWFSLVLLVLPLNVGGPDEQNDTVGPLQAFGAAREAIGDLSHLCARKPEVCETGRATMRTIGLKARETARIALEVLDDKVGTADESITTGGVSAAD